ncbi:TolB protein [Muriicola jejuensis]|uniref:Translocation protein TolB n=2 Tax=Muriicola jejuensis TaxID=504488 RepID=A0A6P0U8H0_9FLAO|nr:translocation protein TolB [Muriicola jejuensis]SMP09049.1 TolB protein [Muriicola jejuensis]
MFQYRPRIIFLEHLVFYSVLVLIGILSMTSCRSDVKKQDAEITKPEGTIAFVSNRDGNMEIYLMDGNGKNAKNISRHPDLDYSPSWMPDGSGIMGYSNRDGNPELYLYDLKRDTAIRFTDHPAQDVLPSISPDGKEIVFMSDRNGKSRSVFKMKFDGSDLVALTDNDAYEESPAWSPDGTHILFTRQLRQEGDTTYAANGEIFRMRSDGSLVERITNKQGYDSGAAYSPDGKQIAFYGPEGDTFEIFLMNADGSDIRNITRDTLDCYSPAWSPDGKWIAYTAGRGENYDLYIIHPESGEKRRLTFSTVRNQSPAWSALNTD